MALNTSALCNINRDPKKTRPFRMEQFSAVARDMIGPGLERLRQQSLMKWLEANAKSKRSEPDNPANPP